MEFLVFQHVPNEGMGFWTEAADNRGVKLDILKLWKPYQMPQDWKRYAGVIVLGGPMGVRDREEKFPSKKDEVRFMSKVLNRLPMMGICLGSQLIAHILGEEIRANAVGGIVKKEIGYYDVELTVEGKADPIFSRLPSPLKVLQWHGDAFDLPKGATLLATSVDCPVHAFRYGKFTDAMLFHNEFTPRMVERQIMYDNKWIHAGFKLDERELVSEAHTREALMRRQAMQLFSNFYDIAAKYGNG